MNTAKGEVMNEKIVFVTNNLQIGGVQISLLNLIKEIHNDFDVTVLSFFCKEEYKELLPANVKLVGLKSPFKFLGVSQGELKGRPFEYIVRSFWAFWVKLFGRSNAVKLMSFFQRKIGGYDVAVSFLHEGAQKSVYGGCNEFVLKKVKADQKIAWLHCDFEQCGANNANSRKIYEQFDKIVACSEGCKNSFVNCLPELENKCVAIRNCNDYERIKQLAENGVEYDKGYFNIVTVARLSQEKGIERAIEAVKYCKDNGYKVRYHIVGSGITEPVLKKAVQDFGLQNDVFFYGNQTNPYKFMVNADLFLLTSYHEAAPMVFDEAACLGVPVLATKTTSTDEMIVDNKSGFVCENSAEAVKNSLFEIVGSPSKLDTVREELKKRKFDNESIVLKLKALF